MRLLAVLLSLFCLSSVSALADADSGLYAPPVPEGAAVVRFLNAGTADMAAKAAGKDYGTVKSHEMTPYYVVKAGDAAIEMGDGKASQKVEAGKHYTAIKLAEGSPVVVEDPKGDNRAKATVILYNLSGAPVTLKAKEGTAAVIENVAAKANGSRELNGVKVDFSVHGADGASLAKLEPSILERGLTYGIVFYGDKAEMNTATTDTRK
jgi:hypothetical protein